MPKGRSCAWRIVSAVLTAALALPSTAFPSSDPSPQSPGDEALASLLRSSYPIGGPGCQPVSLPIIGTFDRMSGHYSAVLNASGPARTRESLNLNASSPIEGPITCTWERSHGEPPNEGWRPVGALPFPGGGDEGLIRCAVTDMFASDTRAVAQAMIAAYIADPSRFSRCEPAPLPADDDANGNGIDDAWERQLANPVTVLACIACAVSAVAAVGFAIHTLVQIEQARRVLAAGRAPAWEGVLTSFKVTACSGLVALATCLICPFAANLELRLATAIFQLTGLGLATVVAFLLAIPAACVGL